jgi:hypothetical protein
VANFCDAGDKVSGYIKCTFVTFYVKSKDSAGNVGKVVTAAAVAQLKCVCVVVRGWMYVRTCVRVRSASIDIFLEHLLSSFTVTIDSVSVMTPGGGQ